MAGDERLERYRLNAEKCLALAQKFNDQESKRALLGMANAWLALADQHLKNNETVLVYETQPAFNEPSKSPPVNELPPVGLNPAEPDDPMQC
jgi:hypothetical protein